MRWHRPAASLFEGYLRGFGWWPGMISLEEVGANCVVYCRKSGMIADELRVLYLEQLMNVVRALATPAAELRANIRSIVSAERILVDEFESAIALGRGVAARSGIPFTDPASAQILERLEAAVAPAQHLRVNMASRGRSHKKAICCS